MQLEDITVEVRNRAFERRGQITYENLDLALQVQFNGVGSWTLALDSDHPLTGTICTPGAGLVVTLPGGVVSGPMTSFGYKADSSTAGQVVVKGVTDDIVLNDTTALPSPLAPLPTLGTQPDAHDAYSGSLEGGMHYYVNRNAGPGAVASRRVDRLVMGANGGRGGAITKAARFDNLGAMLTELALLGSMGFRVVQAPGTATREFQTYTTIDRTKFVRLGVWNDTAASEAVSIIGPTATRVIIAGQGEQTDRTIYTQTSAAAIASEAAWGRRIERFVDQRQTDDTTQYSNRATEILTKEASASASVQIVPMVDETSDMRFGTDWNVGDLVTAVTAFGEYPAVCSGLVLKANDKGFQVGALIGQDTKTSSQLRLNDLLRRLSQLERAA